MAGTRQGRELSETVEIQNTARAESMRRTLWEIFTVDTLLAAVQVGGTLQCRYKEDPRVAAQKLLIFRWQGHVRRLHVEL
jgi:hypothetical protein